MSDETLNLIGDIVAVSLLIGAAISCLVFLVWSWFSDTLKSLRQERELYKIKWLCLREISSKYIGSDFSDDYPELFDISKEKINKEV